jgi:hypothetical protein
MTRRADRDTRRRGRTRTAGVSSARTSMVTFPPLLRTATDPWWCRVQAQVQPFGHPLGPEERAARLVGPLQLASTHVHHPDQDLGTGTGIDLAEVDQARLDGQDRAGLHQSPDRDGSVATVAGDVDLAIEAARDGRVDTELDHVPEQVEGDPRLLRAHPGVERSCPHVLELDGPPRGDGTMDQRAEIDLGLGEPETGLLLGVAPGLLRSVAAGPLLGEGLVQHLEKPASIKVEAGGAQFKRVPVHQLGETGRQLPSLRHLRATNQDRDDEHVALQGRLDLQAHEVVGVVQPPLALLIGDRHPLGTDQCKQHVTGGNGLGDDLGEVGTRRNVVDISKDLVAAEVRSQAVMQPSGREVSLFPSVAQEDPTRSCRGGSSHVPQPCDIRRSSLQS